MIRWKFILLAMIYAYFARDGARAQQTQPVSTPQANCILLYPATGTAGTSGILDNRTVGCINFAVSLSVPTTISAVTWTVQVAQDNGSPSCSTCSWSTLTAAAGANPITSTAGGNATFVTTPGTAFYDYLRMTFTATGTGVLYGKLIGNLGISASGGPPPPIPGCPSGPVPSVQYAMSSTKCAGNAQFTYDGTIVRLGTFDPTGETLLGLGSADTTTTVQNQQSFLFTVTPTGNTTQDKGLSYAELDLDGSFNFIGATTVSADMEVNTSGSVGAISNLVPPGALFGNVNVNSGSSVYATGASGSVQTFAGSTGIAAGVWSWLGLYGGTVTNAYNFYGRVPATGASVTNYFHTWSDALGGLTGTANTYYLWDDEQGVFRIKADNTYNSVYQAIPALYNPQFTKYTPGATNFERVILGQWNSNVAEIGTQAGGTGTLRAWRMIGPSVEIPVTTFANLGVPDNNNSTFNYCSDCTVTSSIDNTCTGSGSGAQATRINGIWKCLI